MPDLPDEDAVYLYVIKDTGRPDTVKMGYATDPEKRVRKLQTGNATPLSLHHAELVPRGFVRVLERHLHKDMHHLRVKGEWYRMSADDAVRQLQFTLIHYLTELEDEVAFQREVAVISA